MITESPFSIIIPVYNEEEILEKNILTLLQYLTSLSIPFEILIIDNGSTDRTPHIGKDMHRRYSDKIEFISLPQRGVGRAFREGVKRAKHPHLISLDMDLAVDLSFVPRANSLLSEYSIVIGSKKLGSQKRSLLRRAGSKTYLFFVNLLLGLNINDFSIGAKAYRRDFVLQYLHLIDDHTHYVLVLTLIAKLKKERIIEIPVFCEDYRKSKFNLLKEGIYRFYKLFELFLKYKFKKLPL